MQRFVAVENIGLILYHRYVNDEWTKYLDALHACVKMRWQYVVPREQEDRALLRTLCEQTLEFENHFLMCYRTYLLSLLRSEDRGSQNFAIDQLGEAHYPDEE